MGLHQQHYRRSHFCNVQVTISKQEGAAGRVAAYVAGVEAEVGVLKQLQHENIVRYLVRCCRSAFTTSSVMSWTSALFPCKALQSCT